MAPRLFTRRAARGTSATVDTTSFRAVVLDVGDRRVVLLRLAGDGLQRRRELRPAAEHVERLEAADGDEPCPRILGHAVARPGAGRGLDGDPAYFLAAAAAGRHAAALLA